ncbi:IPT/TIG domain-containing protein [Chitinimonas taiwanensis]|uniref:IPT/TIG domain-containing protein n=1 Tax=Chitinimonas taiwanensis TaxID=240412 RepID=UPI0035B31E43
MSFPSFVRASCALALLLNLAACGSGGGDGDKPTNTSQPQPPVSSLAIHSVAPLSAKPGDTLDIRGSGLKGTQRATLGGMAASFTVLSDGQLSLQVPAQAVSGVVELQGAGQVAQSAQTVRISSQPSVASMAPSTVKIGGRVSIQGSNLDQVQSLRLNGLPLTIESQTSSTLTFLVPSEARSGSISLHYGENTVLTVPQGLTVEVPISINSFSPSEGVIGTQVTLKGSGFDLVSQVRFGTASAPMIQRDDTSLSVSVPAGAVSGPISLIGNDGAALSSANSFTVVPTIIGHDLQPRRALAGQTITVIGNSLDEVASVSVNGMSVSVVDRSNTSLRFSMPQGGGTVVLRGKRQADVTVGVLTEIFAPVTRVSGYSPNSGPAGTVITISGSALGQVTGASMGGKSINFTAVSDGQLRISSIAGGGAIVLMVGSQQIAVGNFTEPAQPPAVSISGFSPASGYAGSQVTISGSHLDRVSSASMGGVNANIVSRTATSLVLQVPAGGNGAIVLQADGKTISVGNFSLSSAPEKPAVAIQRVEVAQTYLQAPGEGYQRLVPGKPALVRVFVAGSEGSTAPAVQLTASAGGSVLGTLRLSGPSTLSAAPQASVLAQTFNAKLPASWVRSGLSLQVDVDPLRELTRGASQVSDPVVGKATNLRLTVVPLNISEGNLTASMPSLADIRTHLVRNLPVADTALHIEQRAAYRLTSVSKVKESAEWSKTLNELDDLRDAEGNKRHYYGFVPDANFRGGTAGLGYVPGAEGGYNRSSIGLEARYDDDLSTFLHELGHNFGRPHAPCGSAGNPDPGFPYANGQLGPTMIYDNIADKIATPSNTSDVMGYCGGQWFSDYAYSKVQAHLEAWLYPSGSAKQLFRAPVELVEISGSIGLDGVRFEPVRGSLGQPQQDEGDHVLQVQLANGSVLNAPLRAVQVADASVPTAHFKLKLAKPVAEIVGLQLLRQGKALPLAGTKPQSAARQTGDSSGPRLAWREQAGQLTLSWDVRRYRYLSVQHIGQANTVLARQLEGGQAKLDTRALPQGGQWQLVLSDGLHTRLMRVAR